MKSGILKISAILLATVLLFGCGGGGNTTTSPDTGQPGMAELSEYMGIQLFNTSQMRENSTRGPQVIDIAKWRLEITGLVDNPRTYTYDELLNKPGVKRVTWVHCVDGWSAKILWEGFRLRDLLDEAGVKNTALYARFYGYDDYRTWLSVNFVQVNDVMVAYKANGLPLRTDRGFPLHVISQGKYGYKWCKWLVKIELAESVEGFGYYEISGYPAEGNVGDWYYKPVEY